MKAEMVGLNEKRIAALTLHSLVETDRHWVLGQVTREQRDELEALLSELKALGIPSDPQLVAAALQPNAQSPSAARVARSSVLPNDPPALARLLRAEPGVLGARCLALLDAPVRAEVLRLLPGDQRDRFETALAVLLPAPALDAALALVVAERLAAQDNGEPWI